MNRTDYLIMKVHLRSLLQKCKNTLFVEHIQRHLKEMNITSHDGNVCCKICEKDIDEIVEQEVEHFLKENDIKQSEDG